MSCRGVSSVVGTALLILLVILLASLFGVWFVEIEDLGRYEQQFESSLSFDYENELVFAHDASAGATGVVHEVNYEIAAGSDTAGNSLNQIVVEYPSHTAPVSGVDDRSEVQVHIDDDSDGDVEIDASSDVECCPPGDGVVVEDGGSTLVVELSGNYNLDEEDTVILVYSDVTNPSSSDEHPAAVKINGDVERDGQVDID